MIYFPACYWPLYLSISYDNVTFCRSNLKYTHKPTFIYMYIQLSVTDILNALLVLKLKPRVVIVGAHKLPAECCGWKKNHSCFTWFFNISFNLWVSFVSIKVIHTMHTSIYLVILILYFCEFWTFVTYDPNIRRYRSDHFCWL